MKAGSCWSMVGSSPAAGLLRNFIRDHSGLSGPVLLSGEAGVGKSRIARRLHLDSLRRQQPFEVVDCSEFFSEELCALLFGCGDPSVEACGKPGILRQTGGGTCYLARCEEMTPAVQDLLRVYVESCSLEGCGEPRFSRLVLSSSKDIGSFTRAGLFNRRLFDTFSDSRLVVDPLRERLEDLGALVSCFTENSRRPDAVFSTAALEALSSYPWPGNHRELEGEVNRLTRSVKGAIGVEHLSPRVANFWLGGRQDPAVSKVSRQLDECLEELRVLNRLDAAFEGLVGGKSSSAEEVLDPEARSSGSAC